MATVHAFQHVVADYALNKLADPARDIEKVIARNAEARAAAHPGCRRGAAMQAPGCCPDGVAGSRAGSAAPSAGPGQYFTLCSQVSCTGLAKQKVSF